VLPSDQFNEARRYFLAGNPAWWIFEDDGRFLDGPRWRRRCGIGPRISFVGPLANASGPLTEGIVTLDQIGLLLPAWGDPRAGECVPGASRRGFDE